MGTGFAEAPLAIFTTLAPMGAAAFIMLLMASLKGVYAEGSAQRIDKMSVVPVAVVLVGFVGAFFHLANPLNAFFVFDGIGRSPLTNEVLVGCIFVVVAIVYAVLAWMGKLSVAARKAFLAIVGVLAFVFAVFCGMAYMMDTIPAWDQPSSIIQMVGFALVGGAVLGSLVLALSKAQLEPLKVPAFVLAIVGTALAAIGFGMHLGACAEIYTIWGSALEAVPLAWMIFGVLVVALLAASGLLFVALKRDPANVVLIAVASVLVVVAVFLARIAFYGLHVTL